MNLLLPVVVLWTALASAMSAFAADQEAGEIPKRPEQLTYPPLVYKPPDPADYRVQLASGPVAYIVPDRELPLVNIVVYIRGGDYLEPAGKEGLAGITGYLLARGGTKSKTAEELEERLAFLAAILNSGFGNTQGSISLNLLSKDVDEGMQILREALVSPRFQADKLALRKEQIMQEMKQRNDESAAIEARERNFLAYGENFWANRYPTEASVTSIQRDDLIAFHHRWVHPKNIVVAASGDLDRETFRQKLEKLFADWPFTGEVAPPVPTNTVFAEPSLYIVDKDVNQGRVSIVLPGITRDDPDYFPVMLMNRILGGGGFTSRIVNRVRSDEGLAYAAGSSFPGGVYYPLTFTAGFQSKSRTVFYATSLVLDEMKSIQKEPVSSEELDIARQSFIETFPRTFSSKIQIANHFAQDEMTGRFARDPDYWKTYRDKIRAVSADEVQKVARKYFDPAKVVILVVGKKEDILLGHPDHGITLQELSRGKLKELPLRDPLTMKPLTN